MRWSYYWHPPSFGLRAAVREVDSRVANIIWYALLALLGALRGLAHLCILRRRQPQPGATVATAFGLGLHHPGAGDGADRAGQPGVDADRHLCRPAPKAHPDRAAGGAVPGRLPQQSPVSAGGVADRVLERQSRHLAVAADGAGHPVVHPVQCHRRRQRHAAGTARRRPRISACRAGCGGSRVALPAVFPYYVTGAITASGGAWNASIAGGSGELGHDTHCAPMAWAPISSDAVAAGDFRHVCWAPP